jgi:hypothetical protein
MLLDRLLAALLDAVVRYCEAHPERVEQLLSVLVAAVVRAITRPGNEA